MKTNKKKPKTHNSTTTTSNQIIHVLHGALQSELKNNKGNKLSALHLSNSELLWS